MHSVPREVFQGMVDREGSHSKAEERHEPSSEWQFTELDLVLHILTDVLVDNGLLCTR